MRRIPPAKHTKKHNRQQNSVFNEVDHNAPPKLVGVAGETRVQTWRPFGLTLNSPSYQRYGSICYGDMDLANLPC